MRGIRKWLWLRRWDLAELLEPADVTEKHKEVLRLGFEAYNESRKVRVELREDLR